MTNKKVLMVVASEGFRDEELFVPAEILKKAGFVPVVASDKEGKAQGDDGGEIEVDVTINEVKPKDLVEDFEAIVFIGGPGALKHLDNQNSYELVQGFFYQNKITAAICIAPVILAKAGVLQDKKATVWKKPLDRSGPKQLQKQGAEFKDKKILQDGNIITASGPEAAEEFGEKIAQSLQV